MYVFKLIAVLVATFLFSTLSHAATWDEGALCKKVEKCMVQKMEQEMADGNIPPEMEGMIKAQMSMMCQGMSQRYFVEAHPSAAQIKRCQDKILSMSCEEMLSGEVIKECDTIAD